MNWKAKLTSRKFWVALAGLVVGVIALLGIQTDTAQITGVIMALGSVVAYIVGEGLVDAASAGAGDSSGSGVVPQYTAPVVGTVDPAPAVGTPTGAAQEAAIKQSTALSDKSLNALDEQIAEGEKAISEADPNSANLDLLKKTLAALKAIRAIYSTPVTSGAQTGAQA